MTTQTPEPITPAPLTFQAPTPTAPGRPSPIKRGIPWNEPITASKAIDLVDAAGNPEPVLPVTSAEQE
ncbi:hypothetical protein [Pseudarthrobacter sp. LMD1-1-1.1]|uniref:hypothetical protein n=1 Tax=Pseudarthrobacter sp. LMD1-1-1.1 TaxID=3135242 RepID=UPI00341D8054